MTKNTISFSPKVKSTIKGLLKAPIAESRLSVLNELINYIQNSKNQEIQLIFICTHNSRRSQFAQVWAQTAAAYFNIPVSCFSGGVEVTACNERTITSLKRSGIKTNKDNGETENPIYHVSFSDDADSIQLFSKIYDDAANPSKNFAAVMTCSDADQNCPFIPGAEARIPLNYDDPKSFDDTADESAKYDERSRQIASEMFYIMSKV